MDRWKAFCSYCNLYIYIYLFYLYIYIIFFFKYFIFYWSSHSSFFLPDLRNPYIDLFIYLLPFMIYSSNLFHASVHPFISSIHPFISAPWSFSYNRECRCYEFWLSYMATCQCSGSSIMGTRSNFPIKIILSIS